MSENNRPTPETDAAEACNAMGRAYHAVPTLLARKLERERDYERRGLGRRMARHPQPLQHAGLDARGAGAPAHAGPRGGPMKLTLTADDLACMARQARADAARHRALHEGYRKDCTCERCLCECIARGFARNAKRGPFEIDAGKPFRAWIRKARRNTGLSGGTPSAAAVGSARESDR